MLYGHGKIGWIIIQDKRSWVYPTFGSGIAALVFTTSNKNNNQSATEENLTLLSPSFDFGMNGDIIVSKISPDNKSHKGFLLGIRMGYRASPKSNNWRNDDGHKIENIPAYSNHAFYVTIAIGEGGFAGLQK
jgi:hypothetical protein